MNRGLLIGLGTAAAIFGSSVVYRACQPSPPDVSDQTRKQVDSVPQWHQEARDSQAVLDSLQRYIDAARADSARVAASIRWNRHVKDSLERESARAKATLDSAKAAGLPATVTASDTAARYLDQLARADRLITTMGDEITACRQGDEIYEGRVRQLEGALESCAKRAAIVTGQRDRAQIRLDRLAALADTMLMRQKHERCSFGLPCLELVVYGGLDVPRFQGSVGVGVAVPIKKIRY